MRLVRCKVDVQIQLLKVYPAETPTVYYKPDVYEFDDLSLTVVVVFPPTSLYPVQVKVDNTFIRRVLNDLLTLREPMLIYKSSLSDTEV